MNIKKLFQRIFTPEQTNNDVTEFLGIPVDGSPESMRQKLIAKGFKFIPGSDKNNLSIGGIFIGLFNNEPVSIVINTNQGKVWRIVILNRNDYDQAIGKFNSYSQSQAIRKFNNLVTQFDAKANYTRTEDAETTYYVSDDEDFGINVNNQKYLAAYYQGNSKMKLVWFIIDKDKDSDKYEINIFYENLYNKPKKEQSNNNVTKFLGIPVDGSPESIRQKLIEKGFKFIPESNKTDDHTIAGVLIGIFNNEQVGIGIRKNKGKVWRIIVINQNGYSQIDAIRKFNDLVTQFDAKANYTRANEYTNTYYISDYEDDEDFDRNVYEEKYQANYYQGNSKMKLVWFLIDKSENSDKYYIKIYYDNLYNVPKPGEDL